MPFIQIYRIVILYTNRFVKSVHRVIYLFYFIFVILYTCNINNKMVKYYYYVKFKKFVLGVHNFQMHDLVELCYITYHYILYSCVC